MQRSVARGTFAPRPIARRLAPWAIGALLAAGGSGAGQTLPTVTQGAALAYRDPAVSVAEARVVDARRTVDGPSGVGYAVTVAPRAELRDRLDDEAPASWSTRWAASAELSYRHDGVALVRSALALARAERDAAAAERDGVHAALRAHVAWWRGARALAAAEGRHRLARDALEAARAGSGDGGAAGDAAARLADLQLAFDRADLDLREAAYAADGAANAAATFGLRGAPGYAPLRFALPDADLDRHGGVRLRRLAVAEAEAALERAQLFRVVQELRVAASYASDDLRVGAELGVLDRRPGADLSLSTPGATRPQWTVGVRAEIVVDETTWRTIEDARRRLDAARLDLAAYLATLPETLADARRQVGFAEEHLGHAERALALEGARLDALAARLADARARGAAERELAGLERDEARTAAALDRAEGALLTAWNAYLREVHGYLGLAEAGWRGR